MILRSRKGDEYNLVILEDIKDPDEFMLQAFRQALDALQEIVEKARAFDPQRHRLDELLYGYPSNIIAFSGVRGQGKTSTMLSFSAALSNHFKKVSGEEARFMDCSFSVLPPIDPTILEDKQSLLALVLSRMYAFAEQTWQELARNNLSSECEPSEADKNELLQLFQKCLSGINTTKFDPGEKIRGLSVIHEMCDGGVLKKNFYLLTKKLLQFCGGGRTKENRFLVIQLDDTDFQISKGYEILEDIRRYLSIPNIIILMATDTDMLRAAVSQHFFKEFETGLKCEAITPEKIDKTGSKYLDKLMPPVHVVYLPHLDDVILRQSDFLRLECLDTVTEGGRQKEINLLLPPDYEGEDPAGNFSFQSLILRYIYRKTGLVFCETASHLHSIIPTTLRGLRQLLGLLSSMEDVPAISDELMRDRGTLTKGVRAQISVLEANLPLFEGYFLNDWVNSKLPRKKVEAINALANALPDQRVHIAVEQLKEVYQGAISVDERASYSDMVKYIDQLKRQCHRAEDFFFFTAILTYFAIQNHKAVLYQKKRATEPGAKDGAEAGPLIFDLSPDVTGLPDTYYMGEGEARKGAYKEMLDMEIRRETYDDLTRTAELRQISRYMILKGRDGYRFSAINFITFFLSLGEKRNRHLVSGDYSQADIYRAQEAAAAVAMDPEVQEEIRKAVREDSPDAEYNPKSYMDLLRPLFQTMGRAVAGINAGSPETCPMLPCDPAVMLDFFYGKKSLQALDVWARNLDLNLTLRQKIEADLCDIYRWATEIKKLLRDYPVTSVQVLEQTVRLIDEYGRYTRKRNAADGEGGRGIDVDALLYTKSLDGMLKPELFWERFKKQFKELCAYYNFKYDAIYKSVLRRN